jgi:two-component sensor histidine kinase
MAEYLDSLSRQLVDAYSSKSRVEVVPEAEGIVLGVDIAIPCGLIFNELITNALNHAFPGGGRGTIRASLKALDSGRFELSVRDDGVGLPEGAMVPESQALGVALVRLLVEQLDGIMELSTSEGTCCTIEFSGRPRG